MPPHLDRDRAGHAIEELARVLGPSGPPIRLLVVGGMAMIWLGIRDVSVDVDVARGLDHEVAQAAHVVKERLGLPDGWLNASAAGYLPTVTDDECRSVMTRGRVTVLIPPVRVLFAMKVVAGRRIDMEDASALWARCNFTSVNDAAEYVQNRYPHERLSPEVREAIDAAALSAGRAADRPALPEPSPPGVMPDQGQSGPWDGGLSL